MPIRPILSADIAALAQMRHELWPEQSAAEHAGELQTALADRTGRFLSLAAFGREGELIGFAEAAIRRDCVNGCKTSPVVFLEGIYVSPSSRAQGVARALIAAVEAWGRAEGCSELASDALLDNRGSHAMHKAVGFEETERVVYFRKEL